MLLDPVSGAVTQFLKTAASKGINDLVLAPNGDLYFTDQGQTGLQNPTGRVYRLTAAGQLECLLVTGIVIDPEMTHLLVAVTRAGLANSVGEQRAHHEKSVSSSCSTEVLVARTVSPGFSSLIPASVRSGTSREPRSPCGGIFHDQCGFWRRSRA